MSAGVVTTLAMWGTAVLAFVFVGTVAVAVALDRRRPRYRGTAQDDVPAFA